MTNSVASPNNLGGPNSLLGVLGLGRDKKKHKKDVELTDEKAKVKAFDPYHSFHQFKQPDGRWRWVMTTSSGFRDRDGETIPTALLEADSARMKSTGDYGPLRWWHVGSKSANPLTRHPGKGLDIGVCDFSEMHNHAQVESGLYVDERFGDAFEPCLKELGGSKGYFYARVDPDGSGVYTKPIWGFERSVLLKESASNLMATTLKSIFHKEDAVDSQAVMVLKAKLKPEDAHLVDAILGGNDQRESVLVSAGAALKAKKDDEAKEDPKEEAAESPADEKKEDALEKRTKEAPVAAPASVAFDTEALATSLMTKMVGTFVTPSALDAALDKRFSELTVTATKAQDDTKASIEALSVRLKALEGDTPESQRGFKASERGGLNIMEGVLADFAKSQGLDVSKLGIKANQTPTNELDRITNRLADEMFKGTAPIA